MASSRSINQRAFVVILAASLAAGASTVRADRFARASAQTSVNRSTSVNRNVNRDVNVNRNVHRDIDVDRDVDIDRHYGGGYGCCYHPFASAAAATAAAVTTAAVVGSIVHALPPSCEMVSVAGFTYQRCGATWYQPQFAGSTVNYLVINPPR
jgi:hypothetical protein